LPFEESSYGEIFFFKRQQSRYIEFDSNAKIIGANEWQFRGENVVNECRLNYFTRERDLYSNDDFSFP